jgi:short-subunit dehydrogenase
VSFPLPDPAGTAVVTGASSGLGAELAERLGADGYGLTLVARRAERLETLALKLRAAHDVRVEVVAADLTQAAARAAIERALLTAGLRADILVNNAGFATGGPFAESPLEDELRQVRLLCEAPVDLSRRFLPGMLARGRGAILNVVSTAAMQPIPYTAGYGAVKAHALSLTEAVHAEVRGAGVHVTALCPPPIYTELWHKTDHPIERVPRVAWLHADEVARIGLDGLRRNKRVVVPKALARTQATVGRHAPRALQLRFTERVLRR